MNGPCFGGTDSSWRISPARAAAFRHGRGFSLIELLITLAIAVILIVIAVPSFKSLTLSNKLTTTANDMVGAINLARMEAIKRNASTQFCSNSTTANTGDTLGAACGTHTGAVYVLVGPTATATTTQVGADTPGIATPVQISSAGVVALRFGGDGLGHDPTASTNIPYSGPTPVADICTSSMSTNNHRLIKMAAGSILTVTNANGTCP